MRWGQWSKEAVQIYFSKFQKEEQERRTYIFEHSCTGAGLAAEGMWAAGGPGVCVLLSSSTGAALCDAKEGSAEGVMDSIALFSLDLLISLHTCEPSVNAWRNALFNRLGSRCW